MGTRGERPPWIRHRKRSCRTSYRKGLEASKDGYLIAVEVNSKRGLKGGGRIERGNKE